tara:strand:+ start:248 stop:490 length:243 start_codon:yes stop_codon:yes gene_type:complete
MKTKIARLVKLMESYDGKPKTTREILKDYNKKYRWQYTTMEMSQVLSKNKLFIRSKEIGYTVRSECDSLRTCNAWELRRD